MKMYSQKSVYILTFGRAYEKCRLYWTTDCQSAWRCVQGSSQWVRASRCSATCEHKTLLQNLMHYVLLVEGVGSNTYMWDFFFFYLQSWSQESRSHPSPSCRLFLSETPRARFCCWSKNTASLHYGPQAGNHLLSPKQRETMIKLLHVLYM